MTKRYQLVDAWGVKGATLCNFVGTMTLWPENGTFRITSDCMPTQLALAVTRNMYWTRRLRAVWTDPL